MILCVCSMAQAELPRKRVVASVRASIRRSTMPMIRISLEQRRRRHRRGRRREHDLWWVCTAGSCARGWVPSAGEVCVGRSRCAVCDCFGGRGGWGGVGRFRDVVCECHWRGTERWWACVVRGSHGGWGGPAMVVAVVASAEGRVEAVWGGFGVGALERGWGRWSGRWGCEWKREWGRFRGRWRRRRWSTLSLGPSSQCVVRNVARGWFSPRLPRAPR